MAPRAAQKKQRLPSADPNGIFSGMVVFLVPNGVQSRRLQVWKQKLIQMGATVEDNLSKRVTHIFAVNSSVLLQKVNHEYIKHLNGCLLHYEWLENCLKTGERVSDDLYIIKISFDEVNYTDEHLGKRQPDPAKAGYSDDDSFNYKKTRISSTDKEAVGATSRPDDEKMSELGQLSRQEHQDTCLQDGDAAPTIDKEPDTHIRINNSSDSVDSKRDAPDSPKEAGPSELSSLYNPPDLNRNINEIFGKLINIYRALGDDRRSFSYHKAILVIEKLPFKIECIDQVKHLPAIGKSMQDHIHEIVTTGKLSKLEHFETDEKVHTVTLFEEVWGIGPATALKLYEKGHRSLADLKNDDTLTNSQKIGLEYFEDIKKRISRDEVKDMDLLLQKAGQDILPGVVIVCGGSYRRGKSSCGDLDIIITHPDGESHKGFLPRYVQYLKDIKFLREDLIFSIHSTEGTDSGVDTYFGLCTYPGREQRHRIDFKV